MAFGSFRYPELGFGFVVAFGVGSGVDSIVIGSGFRCWLRRGWIGEPVVSDDLRVVSGGSLLDSWSLRIGEVNIVHSEPFYVSLLPLEVVQEGPSGITDHVTSIQING